MDHNPFLKSWEVPTPNKAAGKGSVEIPSQAENIVWQTRAAPPSAYENALGDAIETAFGEGHYELEPLVARINELGVKSPEGTPWTEQRFCAEMARLGY
ncbi:MAG: recombinase-like helix-turn-helix domain-containing protein [Pseudomonadota bacterium]